MTNSNSTWYVANDLHALLNKESIYTQGLRSNARKKENKQYKWIESPELIYSTIIPRAWMGSESIAHEAEGRMGYWFRDHKGEGNNCFSKIQLVGQNIENRKKFIYLKLDYYNPIKVGLNLENARTGEKENPQTHLFKSHSEPFAVENKWPKQH